MSDDKITAANYLLGKDQTDTSKRSLKVVVSYINKDDLIKYLNKWGIVLKKSALKPEIVDKIVELSLEQLQELARDFAAVFALYPTQVEDFLKCTKIERRRWTEERKLRVIEYRKFDYGEFPIYDLLATVEISAAQVQQWRENYQNQVKVKREKAVKKAAETKKENQTKQVIFQFQYEYAVKEWEAIAPSAVSTLKLAYWTFYVSRWAKTYQLKAKRARVHSQKYEERAEFFYELKNQGIKILSVSPHAHLGFYRPPNPNGRGIKDYYSLFYTQILIPGIEEIFSFDTPYPIGESFLPYPEQLPQVLDEQEEGIFRFGMLLYEGELINYSEEKVIQNFQEALTTFKDYKIGEQKPLKWKEIQVQAELRRVAAEQQAKRRLDLKNIKVDLPVGVDLELDIIKPIVTANSQWQCQQLIDAVQQKLVELCIYPEEFKDYPEFSINYVRKAVNKKWDKNTIKTLIIDYLPLPLPRLPARPLEEFNFGQERTEIIHGAMTYKGFLITYSPRRKLIIYKLINPRRRNRNRSKKKMITHFVPDLQTAKYLIDTNFFDCQTPVYHRELLRSEDNKGE